MSDDGNDGKRKNGGPRTAWALLIVAARTPAQVEIWPVSYAGKLPNLNQQRHVQVANILKHLRYGSELMHLGLQTMAYRLGVPETYRPDVTNMWRDRIDGALPDPALVDDLRVVRQVVDHGTLQPSPPGFSEISTVTCLSLGIGSPSLPQPMSSPRHRAIGIRGRD